MRGVTVDQIYRFSKKLNPPPTFHFFFFLSHIKYQITLKHLKCCITRDFIDVSSYSYSPLPCIFFEIKWWNKTRVLNYQIPINIFEKDTLPILFRMYIFHLSFPHDIHVFKDPHPKEKTSPPPLIQFGFIY